HMGPRRFRSFSSCANRIEWNHWAGVGKWGLLMFAKKGLAGGSVLAEKGLSVSGIGDIEVASSDLCPLADFDTVGVLSNATWDYDTETGELTVSNDGMGSGGAFIVASGASITPADGVISLQIKLISRVTAAV